MEQRVRVLIVDDSSFYRARIRRELERTADIEVIGEAADGREAVAKAAALLPDLITMDVAMPVMDGIAAMREIMRTRPVAIVMLSALTRDGAHATLEALEAGAVDFLAKPAGRHEHDAGSIGARLGERILSIARHRRPCCPIRETHPAAEEAAEHGRVVRRDGDALRLVLIGASTGGPMAVQKVLTALPADYPVAVLVAVHMPAEFTPTFAQRLDTLLALTVREARDGDVLRPGRVLIAPGGRQTLVQGDRARAFVKVIEGAGQLYRPSVDIAFGSAAKALGDAVQAVVLTGMGADGTEGARLLKARGARVWSQDKASCVVYGMPLAIAEAGLSDRVLPLDRIGTALAGLG